MYVNLGVGYGGEVPDVRLIIHRQHHVSIEDYLQEFGRAGRNGQQSLAVLLRTKDDRGIHRFTIEKTFDSAQLDAAEREAVRTQKLAALSDVHLGADESKVFSAKLHSSISKAAHRNSLRWAKFALVGVLRACEDRETAILLRHLRKAEP